MIGRLAYGTVFCVLLPAVPAAWAQRLDSVTDLPVIEQRAAGVWLAAAGLALLAAGMSALWKYGDGLPMNAYPPRRFVARGVYRWLSHPIYLGFCLTVAGASVACRSPAGFWIVTPLCALGCAALVAGYEGHDLRRRFGTTPAPTLSLPQPDCEKPTVGEVPAMECLVLVPWLVLYEAVGHLPVPGTIETFFPFERERPVVAWTEFVYAATYIFVVLAPFGAATRLDLRRFAVAGILGTAIGMFAFLVLPFIATPKSFEPDDSLAAQLMELERADGVGGRAAFPSFHVFWALLAARVLSSRGGRWRPASLGLAIAMSASCVTIGMHSLVDVIAGAALFVTATQADAIRRAALRFTERIANSWTEWRLGPIRLINHGFYAGLAAFVGTLIAASLVDDSQLVWLGTLAAASLLGASVWGQMLVGSRTLLRPFGYFGSIAGALAFVCVALLADWPIWEAVGAAAVAAPWIQAIGRMRCLVQGCCHGAPTLAERGIRYLHPRSRVVRLARLGGVPVHPTPLYSVAANAVIGLLLARLWAIGTVPTLVTGVYLILSGMARFVEESYRGEPQTPIRFGLRIYQWFAVVSLAAGIGITWIDSVCDPRCLRFDLMRLLLAGAVGGTHLVAMGVDFPESERRFSRLDAGER